MRSDACCLATWPITQSADDNCQCQVRFLRHPWQSHPLAVSVALNEPKATEIANVNEWNYLSHLTFYSVRRRFCQGVVALSRIFRHIAGNCADERHPCILCSPINRPVTRTLRLLIHVQVPFRGENCQYNGTLMNTNEHLSEVWPSCLWSEPPKGR